MMNISATRKSHAIALLALLSLFTTQSSIAATEVPPYNKYYDTPIRNVLCQAGYLVTLYDNGYLKSCTVANGTQLVGKTGGNGSQFYSCSSSQPVNIYPDGHLSRCIITSNIQVGGHNGPNGGQFYTCKANSLVEIKEDGYLSSCTLANANWVQTNNVMKLCNANSVIYIDANGNGSCGN